jgi:hypothetical protein
MFEPTFAGGGRGRENPFVEVTVNSKEETLKTFMSITSKNSASILYNLRDSIGVKRKTIVFQTVDRKIDSRTI